MLEHLLKHRREGDGAVPPVVAHHPDVALLCGLARRHNRRQAKPLGRWSDGPLDGTTAAKSYGKGGALGLRRAGGRGWRKARCAVQRLVAEQKLAASTHHRRHHRPLGLRCRPGAGGRGRGCGPCRHGTASISALRVLALSLRANRLHPRPPDKPAHPKPAPTRAVQHADVERFKARRLGHDAAACRSPILFRLAPRSRRPT